MDPNATPRQKPGFFADSSNLLLIGIVVILIALIGGIFFLVSRANKSKNTATNPNVAQSVTAPSFSGEWETYTSKLGFSVGYPKGALPTENATKQTVAISYPTEKGDLALFTVTLIDEPFTNSPKGNLKTETINYVKDWKQVTVLGLTGHRYVRNPCPDTCPIESLDLPFKNGTQILSVTAGATTPSDFDKIVSHLSVTK